METDTGINLENEPADTAIRDFLDRLKPLPEYRGPEYWYRHLSVLADERKPTVG